MKNYKNYTQYKLYEYLQQEEQWLYKYFNMSDDDKYINNAWMNQYYIKKFIDTISLENYFTEEELESFDFDTEVIDNNEDEDIFYEFEDYEKNKKKKDFLIAFGEWCYENLEYYEQPANLMFHHPERFKKDWILYKNNSNKIKEIWFNGFVNGLDEYDELYNWFYNDQDNQYGDIHIGRPINNISSYNFDVGKEEDVLMFKSSGVKVSDLGNNIDVVAFYGKAVYDLVWLEYGFSENDEQYEVWFVESDNNGRLVELDDFEQLVEWVEKNYDQYRNHLRTDKYEIIQKKKKNKELKDDLDKFNI